MVSVFILVNKSGKTSIRTHVAYLISALLTDVHTIFGDEGEGVATHETFMLQVIAGVVVNQLHFVPVEAKLSYTHPYLFLLDGPWSREVGCSFRVYVGANRVASSKTTPAAAGVEALLTVNNLFF